MRVKRQYRLLNQTITMHAILRDRYSTRALILDVMLLICSIIFCATTFAPSDLYTFLGIEPDSGRIILGIASVVAFMAAIISLRVDWKARSNKHRDAAKKLSDNLKLFRENKNENDGWEKESMAKLNQSYWEAMRNIEEIPDKFFNPLKAKHLRKVEISKLSSSLNGCPIFILKIIVLWRAIKKALKTINQ